MLWVKKDVRDPESFVFQYYNAKNYRDKFESLDFVVEENHPQKQAILTHVLNDDFWVFRRKGLKELDLAASDTELWSKIAKMAKSDPDSRVRTKALERLGQSNNKKHVVLLEQSVKASKTYGDVSAALSALAILEPSTGEKVANTLANDDNIETVLAVARAYAAIGDPKHLPYFLEKLPLFKGFDVFPFFESFTAQAKAIKDSGTMDTLVGKMLNLSTNPNTPKWKRFSAAQLIAELSGNRAEAGKMEQAKKYREIFEQIVAQEKDRQLRGIYSRF